MGLPSVIAALRKVVRELFSGTDKSGCRNFFSSLANAPGESQCPILIARERCEALYSTVYRDRGNSDFNCDRDFLELARACLTCRSKFAPLLARTAASNTPPYELANIHMFREVMKAADIPKRTIRDTNDYGNPTQPSGWSATQILTPIIVAIVLCLAVIVWVLYQTGRLSRLTSSLSVMRRSRHARHRWTIDNDEPSGALHHAPDAEATPMIGPVLRWRSLSLKNDARKRFSTRMGVLTPAFSKGIRSVQRLFGWGPVKVSRVPVPDTFDLEDPVTEADPFDTPRSTLTRSWGNGTSTVGRNSDSTFDRIPSPHNLINKPSWSSAALELVLDNGQENYEDTGNVLEDDRADDHDHGMDAGNRVMLISRDGEDFSLSGSMISVPIGRRSIEDQRSIEVVPPSPITINEQSFRQSPSIARCASTPLLCPPSPEKSHIRPFFPSTDDLSNLRFHPTPKPSFISPTHFSMQPAASSGVQPSREDAPGIHLFTTATPPTDHGSVESGPYGSLDMASTRTLPPTTSSHLSATGYSPSASPDLQNYTPSSPGRSPRGSAYYLPPSPVPVPRPINASDPQNLIPHAVRAAGYNPYQHARSVSAFQ